MRFEYFESKTHFPYALVLDAVHYNVLEEK
jgi:hypothetical protein